MYNVTSPHAEEFISHEEILDTLKYAEENKENRPLLDQILAKAATYKGLTHREAAVLLECPLPEYKEKLFALAKEIKRKIYGDRIVLFAPLYLSNYCINGCVYCPYHSKNRDIRRKKLTQEEIKAEVMALEAMGHKRIVIESGEDPLNNPLEYILESIKTIYSIKKDNGEIRRVNVNIAACEVEDYKNYTTWASGPILSSKKPTIRKITKPFIQRGLSPTMHTIQKLWTGLCKGVLMM